MPSFALVNMTLLELVRTTFSNQVAHRARRNENLECRHHPSTNLRNQSLSKDSGQ